MNGTIGEEKNAFFLHKDNIRNHIAHFPPFDTIIDRGKQAIMDNLHQFKKGETGEVNKQTANNILESNKIDPPAVLKTNVENQMSKNQILEYCIQNFGLNFTKTSLSATEDPELYHLFSLLNRSINSNNSLKSKKCLEMLVESTNIHQKLQQLGNHQHPPSIDIYINNSSVDNTTTKHSDPTLDLIFSEDHCKDSISRGKALNTYLSAYSKGIGNEEKIDITKLYEDLQCITEKKPYKQPDKLVLVNEPLQDKTADEYLKKMEGERQ
ncbi:MAG: hypothetical protein LBG59_06360 [Candidatus Peribacteria bacterium]|jgi:hypothetical protein|nr:hypothetical protein [Candidatus Peribacteria bacterium]